jgi:hypothetical protein
MDHTAFGDVISIIFVVLAQVMRNTGRYRWAPPETLPYDTAQEGEVWAVFWPRKPVTADAI